jgi:thioredoxin 1
MPMGRVVLAILAGMVLVLSGCRDHASTEAGRASDRIREALHSGRPAMVNFGDETCYPCRKMKPVLEQAKKDYSGRATILSIDIRKDRDLPQKYRLQLVPTQIFFDESGREAGRHVGFMDRAEIDRNLKALGAR